MQTVLRNTNCCLWLCSHVRGRKCDHCMTSSFKLTPHTNLKHGTLKHGSNSGASCRSMVRNREPRRMEAHLKRQFSLTDGCCHVGADIRRQALSSLATDKLQSESGGAIAAQPGRGPVRVAPGSCSMPSTGISP